MKNNMFGMLKRGFIRTLVRLFGDRGQIWIETQSILYKLKHRNAYEKEIDLLAQLLTAGDTCMDVGANIGQWTFYMSKIVGPSGKVFAIEPMPITYEVLKRVINKLKMKNVSAHQIALGDKDGWGTMHVDENKDGVKSLATAYLSGDERSSMAGSKIRIKTLDGFIESTNINKIKLIKCDIEGAELFFLKGGANVLMRDKPVLICEIQYVHTLKYGYRPKNVFDFMRSFGYQPYKYILNQLTPINEPDPEGINYIFIYNDKK